MTELLSDRTAVVTGAASGNGRGIARRMASHGADVVVADVRASPRGGGVPTHELVAGETDAAATFVECDVTDPGDVADAVEAADEFGGIDVMVNNAGVVGPEKPLVEIEESTYREVMAVNLDGTFYGSRVAAERMIDRGVEGSIVNVCSLAGLIGHADIGPYSVSKGGVKLLTYTLAAELAEYGIRVNAVHPGIVRTAMLEDMGVSGTDLEERMAAGVPLGRLGEPEDVGDAVVYLASDLASYVTGESHLVDGGMTNTTFKE